MAGAFTENFTIFHILLNDHTIAVLQINLFSLHVMAFLMIWTLYAILTHWQCLTMHINSSTTLSAEIYLYNYFESFLIWNLHWKIFCHVVFQTKNSFGGTPIWWIFFPATNFFYVFLEMNLVNAYLFTTYGLTTLIPDFQTCFCWWHWHEKVH